MQIPANLRARISALGELSRPLGETRAAMLARDLSTQIANDVARGSDPNATIDDWIRRLASEILSTGRTKAAHMPKPGIRRLADVLPEVTARPAD